MNFIDSTKYLLSIIKDDTKEYPVDLTVGDVRAFFKYFEHIENLYNIATEDIDKLQDKIKELEQTIKNMNENSKR